MPRHHYVPQFLLRPWASQGQLRTFRWLPAASKVVIGRASPAACCQIEDLHSYLGEPRARGHDPEIDFFTPKIDTPAADARVAMLERGVQGLTPFQRRAWSKFLAVFGARTPETLRNHGPQHFRKAMAVDMATPRGPLEVEVLANALIAAEMPAHERNVPLSIAMEFAEDPTKYGPIEAMHWWLRRFDEGKLLIGDRPLLSQPSAHWPCGVAIDDPNCLVALPIAPDTVFLASANRRYRSAARTAPRGRLLRALNTRTIKSAVEYVYAADRSTDELIRGMMTGREQIWPLNRNKDGPRSELI